MPLDPKRIGKSIADLRKRAGFSQKGLADRLFISDKAVSKWERGLSVPDIAYLGKLSVLLDVDIDTLLEGKHYNRSTSWKGFLCVDHSSQEVSLLTTIYDKPLVYYLLSNFLLVGIEEILISCTLKEKEGLIQLLGDGESLGIHLTYTEKTPNVIDVIKNHAAFFKDCNVMTVFESCVLFGASMTYLYQRAMLNHGQHTVIAIPATQIPENENCLCFDETKRITPKAGIRTVYQYSHLPVLFSPSDLLFEDLAVKKTEDSVLDALIESGYVHVETANRGIIKISVLNQDDVLEASEFVNIIQKRSGSYLGCLEEIAWRRGLIDDNRLRKMRDKYHNTRYGDYLDKI